jgi:hypothetical protein
MNVLECTEDQSEEFGRVLEVRPRFKRSLLAEVAIGAAASFASLLLLIALTRSVTIGLVSVAFFVSTTIVCPTHQALTRRKLPSDC